jgi:hypothetical protein
VRLAASLPAGALGSARTAPGYRTILNMAKIAAGSGFNPGNSGRQAGADRHGRCHMIDEI